MAELDLVVRNAQVVRPGTAEVVRLDIGVSEGRIASIEPALPVDGVPQVVDAGGRLVFPGAVDAHQHWGIYNPLAHDARSESEASAQGGVTTGLTYMRTGQYYMNKSGPYATFFPEVLAAADGNAYIDYAFHLAPMTGGHLAEIPALVADFGVPSFKIFMFYGSFGLHGASADQRQFLMIGDDESYDLAHFEMVMRSIQAAREAMPELADDISLSMHCETAEIMQAYTTMVMAEGRLSGLEVYSAARPPHSEGLAVAIAAYLAHATSLPNINLLHLSSAEAMESAMRMAGAYPHINFRREVTIGHLLTSFEDASGLGGKVNPPLRSPADVDALWEHVLAGDVDWVASDHACCREETKFGDPREDVFAAKSGFGGAEYLLPGLITEGRCRGLSYQHIARLTSLNPAQRFGLHGKGDIAVGYDADLAIVDPDCVWQVHAAESASTQEYTPFEGREMTARVTDTFVRGQHVLAEGKIAGEPRGRYIRRPMDRP